ncbi:MAG: hypothetical protein AVDCRST_MAG05-2384 [uncultured Rubrobacteraceae bacterium]|uniref:Uncharacterized protein n=1 Tax=uncultured Rubrobacteraceae bacterium TaxID=349277 RepID=A0A6J4SIH4_9ACTN|nr:MAG: hypothetical protein AVDCRST_MAG05-2384 [uncultured Rubrobacteraceae bacterium]
MGLLGRCAGLASLVLLVVAVVPPGAAGRVASGEGSSLVARAGTLV